MQTLVDMAGETYHCIKISTKEQILERESEDIQTILRHYRSLPAMLPLSSPPVFQTPYVSIADG